jgi:monooxygenase
MHTLGYSFKPWEEAKAIADGPAILRYMRETAREHGIERLIRYRQQVRRANWNSAAQCWELTVEDGASGESRELRARFLHMCAGYYSYSQGHQPDFPGREDFRGDFVHPQFWPEDLDYSGKRVVVIGSGATAMTLVPAMADEAAEVVMLQRSPTWVVSPAGRKTASPICCAHCCPEAWAYASRAGRTRACSTGSTSARASKPEKVREHLLEARARKELDGRR